MIVKYLWIEKYKRFKDIQVFFNNNKTSIEEDIFKKMNLTLLIGENGAGKTTILSFIAHIFRNIERYHERIPSNFIIKYCKKNYEVEIEKKDDIIFFVVNGNKRILLKNFIKSEKSKENKYKLLIKNMYLNIERVEYEDIRTFLPSNIIVSAFDIDYPDDYSFNYIGDRLLKIKTISLNYKDTAFDMGISLGICNFFEKYFCNSNLQSLMNDINFKFSNNICIYRKYINYDNRDLDLNLDSDQELYLHIEKLFFNFYEELGFRTWEQFLTEYNFQTKYEFLQHIVSDSYWSMFSNDMITNHYGFEGNEVINIKDFLRSKSYNRNILERMIKGSLLYINEFFIIKNEIEVPLRDMSTGEKMFLCRLFYILSRVEKDSVIILEEPEIHLNHSWVKQIISIITLLFNEYNVHFIISTHNYSFINNVFRENILLINDNSIKKPDINTFLANERSISLELFKGSKINNIFEERILELIRTGNRESLLNVLNVVGESYYKFLAFKRLDELEGNYVECE